MEAIECIRSRMSIRRFLPEPVPQELIASVIETARWSPSYKNSQPWEAIVVSGERKNELSRMLVELLEAGSPPSPDLPEPVSWPPVEKERIACLIRKRCEMTGLDLNDPEVKRKTKTANFQFYGAPHGIFLFQDASLTAWSMLDMGMFAQSLMLAAHASGLATVPQAFLTDYAVQTRAFLGIPPSKRLVLGMSLGYPDKMSKVNSFRPDRVEPAEIVRFLK